MLLNRRACGVAPFGSRPVVAPRRAVVNSRQPLQIAASAVAQPATLPYKAVDGADKGKQSMALKVAGETGKGLVHRYLVMVQQNARRVRHAAAWERHASDRRQAA